VPLTRRNIYVYYFSLKSNSWFSLKKSAQIGQANNNHKGIYSVSSAPANGEAKENKNKTQPPYQPTYNHDDMKLPLPSLQP
jgi:hypothetical protein